MPDPHLLHRGLSHGAEVTFVLAMAWHAVLISAWIAAARGLRVSERTLIALLAVPVLSVSAVAWLVSSDPFNGGVFAGVAIVISLAAFRGSERPIRPSTGWRRTAARTLLLFAWFYPHFLESRPPLAYVYGAPMGVLPCPTLALVLGLNLLVMREKRRGLSTVLGLVSLFYGAFGVLRLGVRLDALLVAGALAQLADVLTARTWRDAIPA